MVTVDLGGDLRRQIEAKQVVCFVGAGVSVASSDGAGCALRAPALSAQPRARRYGAGRTSLRTMSAMNTVASTPYAVTA